MMRVRSDWLIVVVVLGLSGTVAAHAADRPDVVYILADDLGRNDVGFMGSKEIRTPNVDRLAAGGTVLKQFYVQPVCSPTRAALLTGRYPMRYGLQVGVIRPWANYGLPLEERTLPAALREAGYTTALVGKWHLGSFDQAYWPKQRGFDRFYGHLFGAIDYFEHIRDGKSDWYRDNEPLKAEGYTTHLIAKEASAVIREQPKDKPLFLIVAFNAVHAPHQVPREYARPYTNLRGVRRTYAGMVAAMDEAVGQIVTALDESGRRPNTLVVFSSDNGGPNPGRITDNGELRAGKGTLYEGGVRVCALANWPGRIQPGGTLDQPLHVVDWYPTILRLAGAKAEQKLPVDGRDLWPYLTEGKPSPRGEILINAEPTRGAIRAGDWKLVITETAAASRQGGGGGGGIELFNLRDDVSERTNLAESNPQKVAELRGRYEAYARTAAEPKNRGEGAAGAGDRADDK
jgi:arylsulfatase A-like enzyme